MRKQIEGKLSGVHEGNRVSISKDLLDVLLFDTYIYRNKNGEKKVAKIPAWGGQFLRKIDLGEVSFEDVSWSAGYLGGYVGDYDADDARRVLDNEKISHEDFRNYNIDYSYTNISVDFEKSFEFKEIGQYRVLSFDFEGVDLSKVDISNAEDFWYCDLTNTELNIPIDIFKNRVNEIRKSGLEEDIIFDECNLAGFDFNNLKLDFYEELYWTTGDECKGLFRDCNLAGTGIEYVLDKNTIKKLDEPQTEEELSSFQKYYNQDIKEMVDNGYLDGCKINNVVIRNDGNNIPIWGTIF